MLAFLFHAEINVTANGAETTEVAVCLQLNLEEFSNDGLFEGSVSVKPSGKLQIKGWLLEELDIVKGHRFTLNIGGRNAQRLPGNYAPGLSKGLLVFISASSNAVLRGHTSVGDFDIPVSHLMAGRIQETLDGKLIVRQLVQSERLTASEGEEDFPSVSTTSLETLAAYVRYDGKSDRIFFSRLHDGTWNAAEQITSEPGNFFDARVAVDAKGRSWVIWSAYDGNQWDLWARFQEGQTWSKPMRLTTSQLNDFWARIAVDASGRLWVAWQGVDGDLEYEIYLAELTRKGLRHKINVSEHSGDDWEPSLCVTGDGRVVVAWDTYRNGSFDIYMRIFKGGRASGPAFAVAASARREAHASVAADSEGRIWIAWDRAQVGWGKRGGGFLHIKRDVDLAVWDRGKFYRPRWSLNKTLSTLNRNPIEYPTIIVDGDDRPHLVFRVANPFHPTKLGSRHANQIHTMWHLFATNWDWRGWSQPSLIMNSEGRQDSRVDWALLEDGRPVIVFTGDNRLRSFPAMPRDHDIFLARLSTKKSPAPTVLSPADDLGKVTRVEDGTSGRLARKWREGSNRYSLLFGDLHRHTDISQCTNGRDGSLQDAYRYAMDVMGLDFLAITDHDQDLLRTRVGGYIWPRKEILWWRSNKYCSLYTIPGRFWAFPGYEYSSEYSQRGGHKNIIYSRKGIPILDVKNHVEQMKRLESWGAIAIPHQLADGQARFDWTHWNESVFSVAEIFQIRGSYECKTCPRLAHGDTTEGFFWQDALEEGPRVGAIASSDHVMTDGGRIGLYVDQFTRDGIFQAIKERRSFAATVTVSIRLRMGDAVMGQETVQKPGTPLEGEIESGSMIRKVVVVQERKSVLVEEPMQHSFKFSFTDPSARDGKTTYYYIRFTLDGDDLAWSSPLWVRYKS